MPGLLITFEGPEGAGKSTQINLLAEYLVAAKLPVKILREPGGTELGEQIRGLLLDPNQVICPSAEVLLYAAARAQLVEKVIKPAISANEIILCDRYVDASIAYQGWGRDLGVDPVKEVNAIAINGMWPDLTILLDIPPEIGLARARNRQGKLDRIEQETIEFHNSVRQGYLHMARHEPERFLLIDVAEKTPENIAEIVWQRVGELLNAKGVMS